MCRRDTHDPLVRMFLDKWRLNPLAVPQEDTAPGQLWIKRGRQIAGSLELAPLLVEPISLPPARTGQQMTDLDATTSRAYDVKVGLGLLEAFLMALGAGGVVQRLHAGYEHRHARTVKLRFTDCTRDRIDPGRLGLALAPARFSDSHPLYKPDDHRYIAASVVRSPSLTIIAQDESENSVDLDADVLQAVSAHAGVDVSSSTTGELTYTGKRLAIGVELYELHTAQDGRLSMGLPGGAQFSAGKPGERAASFLGEDEEALIAPGALSPRARTTSACPSIR